METAVAAVREGLGFAWLPLHRIRPLLDAAALKPLPLAEGGTYRGTLFLVYGCGANPGPATRQLAGLLRESAAEPIYPG
jgi:DNA-binding transcriptional LysR family regulator